MAASLRFLRCSCEATAVALGLARVVDYLFFRAAPTPGASALAEFLARLEAEHGDPVAAFDHLTAFPGCSKDRRLDTPQGAFGIQGDSDTEFLRASYLVYFETAFSSVRAWSIWSYAYVAMAVVVIVPPSQASDS
jgi:hypothetical protein